MSKEKNGDFYSGIDIFTQPESDRAVKAIKGYFHSSIDIFTQSECGWASKAIKSNFHSGMLVCHSDKKKW